ncbi:MAG TPA: AAA family ATPase [Pseudobdellovibrionaceae bacterium]|nr:AAA family ATPase [Pseudobdellovibrionaceae bacterium]
MVSLFYEKDSQAVHFLTSQGLSQFDIVNYISHGLGSENNDAFLPPPSGSEKSEEDSRAVNSALETYCVNLNQKAQSGKIDPLIGREDNIERVVQILCRRTKNNPLLIGEPGVGKTAIIEGLAKKIIEGTVPEVIKNKTIYSLDMGSLLAGTKFRGDFESRLKSIIKEVKEKPNTLLFIDEIHTLVGAGATSGGSMDASNLLKPALASGEVSCIGSTTQTEYRQHFEKDRALNRRFQKISIEEPSPSEALEILKGLKKNYEEFHGVLYTDAALKAAVELSQKHIQGKLLPDKAIDLMDEAGAHSRLENLKAQNIQIDAPQIESVLAKMTGLPISSISSNEKSQLRNLDKKLKALIFGQDEAIDKLVTAIKLSRSGLNQNQKPIGSFLFVGPTGVGKTEVSKQLSLALGVPFHRFDMSEYMEKHSVARLVGAPPGYVGFEQGGLLTELVNQKPYSILLLDEIEKAHPDIYNILLQVMDAGRLTDSNGRVTDFKNVILIMTSNAGALDAAKGNIGLVDISRNLHSLEAVKKVFSPEFINRLDSIVSFKDLSEDIILQIVQKYVGDLILTLAEKKVDLSLSETAMLWLRKKGYDKSYGARPLGRTIDEYIKKPLVDELLFGRLSDGGKVSVDTEMDSQHNERLVFHYATLNSNSMISSTKSGILVKSPVN